MAGTVIWGYFAMCLTKTSNTFVANAGLFGKVYFPRLAVPISISISNLINFGIQFLLFLGFVLFFWLTGANVQPNAAALLTPLLVLMMAGLGLGFGIIVSSMTTRYRDLTQLVAFGVQLLMYATPVIYPISAVPERLRTAHRPQPAHLHHRDLSLRLPGRRHHRLGRPALQLRLHARRPVHRPAALQPHRAELHGHRVKARPHGRPTRSPQGVDNSRLHAVPAPCAVSWPNETTRKEASYRDRR